MLLELHWKFSGLQPSYEKYYRVGKLKMCEDKEHHDACDQQNRTLAMMSLGIGLKTLDGGDLKRGKPCGRLAAVPRRSSIRSSWLYLAMRSDRHGAPDCTERFFSVFQLLQLTKKTCTIYSSMKGFDSTLIWPQRRPTARSAMEVSSVSPLRCDVKTPHPADLAIVTAAILSVTLPI